MEEVWMRMVNEESVGIMEEGGGEGKKAPWVRVEENRRVGEGKWRHRAEEGGDGGKGRNCR